MKQKLKNEGKYLMCAGCGQTFAASPTSLGNLNQHQKETNCEGFFSIELIDK